MFITLTVMIVSRVYAYVQAHQIVYIKHMQFFCRSIIPQQSCQKKKENKIGKPSHPLKH